MIMVLDASAAVCAILQLDSDQIKEKIDNADWVIAPYLFIPETTNALWKYYRHKAMTAEKCESAIEQAVLLPDDYFSEGDLYKEAFNLACITQKPVYDMFYLVLARRNNAYLLTLDKSLKQIAAKQSIRCFE